MQALERHDMVELERRIGDLGVGARGARGPARGAAAARRAGRDRAGGGA